MSPSRTMRRRLTGRFVWILAIAPVLLLVIYACNAAGADSSTRSLRLPTDREVGTVYWSMPDGKPFLYAKHYRAWKPVSKTRGIVDVPAEAEVRLEVGEAASHDLAWLDALRPDDIQSLDLRNRCERRGIAPRGEAYGFARLDLYDCPVSDAGLKRLDTLTNLEEIDLGGLGQNREGYGDGAMRMPARLPKLRRLGLWESKVTDAGLAELVNCRSLTHLELNGTKVGDAGLAKIVGCQSLTYLRVEDTKITDAGLVHLAKLPQLETLWIGENEGVTDEGLKAIGRLVNLTVLDLMSTKISREGLAQLSGLKKLKTLLLDRNDIEEADLAYLAPLESLEELRLYYIKGRITDVGAEHLARLKSLRTITASTDMTDKGVALLATLPHLEQLLLDGQGVTDGCASDIAKMNSLKKLWFQDCPITDAMLQQIAALPNLEDLTIHHTRVTGEGFTPLRDAAKLRKLWIHFGEQKLADQPRCTCARSAS